MCLQCSQMMWTSGKNVAVTQHMTLLTVQRTSERDGKEMLEEEGSSMKVIMSGKKGCECADVKEMTTLRIHKEIKNG